MENKRRETENIKENPQNIKKGKKKIIYENNIERELNQNIFNSFSGLYSKKIEDDCTVERMPLTEYTQSVPV